MLLGVSHTVSKRRHLLAVRDLLHIAQVNGFLVDHDCLSSHGLHLDPVILPESFSRPRTPLEIRFLRRCLRTADRRVTLRCFLCISGNILRHVTIHLDNGICNVEISARASSHDHSGNPVVIIQLPYPLNKRRDRLHVAMNDSLHQFIPDHKVGRTRILVDQKKGSSRLDTLYYICCL